MICYGTAEISGSASTYTRDFVYGCSYSSTVISRVANPKGILFTCGCVDYQNNDSQGLIGIRVQGKSLDGSKKTVHGVSYISIGY